MVVEGKVEKYASGGGAINVVITKIAGLAAPGQLIAEVRELSPPELAPAEDEPKVAAAAGGGDFRAVAPPVMSFAQGRSR